MYRPPATPANKFSEALEAVDKWIEVLENKLGKSPNLFTAGDFNFPGMGSWTVHDMDTMTTNASIRANNSKDLGNTSEQIKKLVETINKNCFYTSSGSSN